MFIYYGKEDWVLLGVKEDRLLIEIVFFGWKCLELGSGECVVCKCISGIKVYW